MNRERLKILRDHLEGLPDERVDMRHLLTDSSGVDKGYDREPSAFVQHCGTAACIAGWANALWTNRRVDQGTFEAAEKLGLNPAQKMRLFMPPRFEDLGRYTRLDAIAAIDSMLASPDDDALPVWPEKPNAPECPVVAQVGEG